MTPANTVGLLCIATPPASGLPATATTPASSPIRTTACRARSTGQAGADQRLGGLQDDTFLGGADSDTVAYAGLAAAGISRAAGVTATLPERPAGPATTGNGQTSLENDTINPDVGSVVSGNGNDNLTGSNGPDTIAGAVPPGTPLVTTTPAGVDTIDGRAARTRCSPATPAPSTVARAPTRSSVGGALRHHRHPRGR